MRDDGPAAPVEGLAHHGHRRRGRRETAASAARWDTLATLEVSWRLDVGGGRDGVGRPDQPSHPPAGHGVGLGHAVHHQAPVGQLGHQHRHGVVLGAAVDEVLVDLVGQHPQAPLDGPAPDRLDLARRVDGPGRVGRRDEEEHLGPRRRRPPRGRSTDDPEPGRLVGGHRRRAPRRPGRSTRGRWSSRGRGRGPRRRGRTARRRRWPRPACRRWSRAPGAAVTV